MECRRALPHERGLAVEIDVIGIHRGLRLGEDGHPICRYRVVVELIVHAGAYFLEREIGGERLRSTRELIGFIAVIDEQIFQPSGPMRRDGRLDTGAGRPAETPYKRRLACSGREIGQRLLVIGPGKPAGRIKQPASRRVADAAAHRTGREHGFAEILRAECRRCGIDTRSRAQPRMRLRKIRECGVRFTADENAVRQHVIVAALDAREEASRFVEGVDSLINWRGAGRPRRRPVRRAKRAADMAAGIETVPVISGASEGNRQSLRHHIVVGRGAFGKRHDGGRSHQQKPVVQIESVSV